MHSKDSDKTTQTPAWGLPNPGGCLWPALSGLVFNAISTSRRSSWLLTGLSVVCLMGIAGCGGGKENSGTGLTSAPPQSLKEFPECEGAILPTPQTIESGEYAPLSRPLFMYVSVKALQKAEVAGFMQVVLNEAQEKMESLASFKSFIKLDPKTLKQQQEKLQTAIGDLKIPEAIESGTVAVDGSSTVFPFSAGAAELFETKHHKKVRVTVGKKGTGGGFERFCSGETDISNASRPIKESEIAKAKEHGVEFIELKVCIDGITVCVNSKNDFCHCLSVDQLKALWEPDSKITKWKQLNPAWPDAEIKLFGPDTDSGTFDYFTEVIVGKPRSSRPDYSASSEDNQLVTGVGGDKNALGYFGYTYFDKNRKTLNAVGIKPSSKGAKKADGEKKADPEKSADSGKKPEPAEQSGTTTK